MELVSFLIADYLLDCGWSFPCLATPSYREGEHLLEPRVELTSKYEAFRPPYPAGSRSRNSQ
jgi:hypothetical protein